MFDVSLIRYSSISTEVFYKSTLNQPAINKYRSRSAKSVEARSFPLTFARLEARTHSTACSQLNIYFSLKRLKVTALGLARDKVSSVACSLARSLADLHVRLPSSIARVRM